MTLIFIGVGSQLKRGRGAIHLIINLDNQKKIKNKNKIKYKLWVWLCLTLQKKLSTTNPPPLNLKSTGTTQCILSKYYELIRTRALKGDEISHFFL